MSTPSSANKSSEPIDPLILVMVGVLAIAMLYGFWRSAHTQIATGYAWMRIAQFSVFKLIHSIWAAAAGAVILLGSLAYRFGKNPKSRVARWGVAVGLFLVVAGLVGRIYAAWFDFFWQSDLSLVELAHLYKSSLFANGFTLLVFLTPFCVWIGRQSLRTNPTNHKHFARARDYTLHTFSDEMGKHYPHIRLFRKIDLTARPIDSGKYRMSDTEKQFAIKHKLLDRVGDTNEFKVNRDRAAVVFRDQMGKLWRNWNDLSKWEVALFAILLPRIAATDIDMPDDEYEKALEKTDTLKDRFWEDAANTYDKATDMLDLDVSDGIATVRKYVSSRKVKPYFKRHAYVYSILYAMLNDARSLGVLPADEVRWLRVVDRELWLMMDNVGRITPFTEVAGLYCHFMHEVKRKRAIEKPEVDNAVKGLFDAVDGYKFSEDEIAQINSQLEADAILEKVIDPQSVAATKKTYIMGSLRVRSAARQDFLEVALLNEGGEVVYSQRCQPEVPIEEIQSQHRLTDSDISALLKEPRSNDVKRKLMELCNGHDLITFYKAEPGMVPGLDRSAASVNVLEDDDGMDLNTTVVMEEIVPEPPSIRSAVDAAKLTRLLWLEMRKAQMRERAAAAGASQP